MQMNNEHLKIFQTQVEIMILKNSWNAVAVSRMQAQDFTYCIHFQITMEETHGDVIVSDPSEPVKLSTEVSGGTTTVRGRKKSVKAVRERTEPLSGYAFFVKEEKQKIGKSKLNMKQVNHSWGLLTSEQTEHYSKLSRLDKLSLGGNYRKREREKKEKVKTDIKKVQKTVFVKSAQTVDVSSNSKPTLCSLLKEVQDLDQEISTKLSMKQKQCQELLKLRVEAERNIKELGELDISISHFRSKCNTLKKKLNKCSD